MSTSSPTPSTNGNQGPSFSVLYVVIGGVALFSIVLFPIAFMFTVRRFRQRSPTQQPLDTPGVISGEDLQQEEPELFDVYVKPGLQVHDAALEHILPLAVRVTSPQHAPPVTHALSTPLRTRYQLRSQDREVYKAEAPVDEDPPKTHDVAILIAMPQSRAHTMDHWDELGEYTIGTTKLATPVSPNNLTLP